MSQHPLQQLHELVDQKHQCIAEFCNELADFEVAVKERGEKIDVADFLKSDVTDLVLHKEWFGHASGILPNVEHIAHLNSEIIKEIDAIGKKTPSGGFASQKKELELEQGAIEFIGAFLQHVVHHDTPRDAWEAYPAKMEELSTEMHRTNEQLINAIIREKNGMRRRRWLKAAAVTAAVVGAASVLTTEKPKILVDLHGKKSRFKDHPDMYRPYWTFYLAAGRDEIDLPMTDEEHERAEQMATTYHGYLPKKRISQVASLYGLQLPATPDTLTEFEKFLEGYNVKLIRVHVSSKQSKSSFSTSDELLLKSAKQQQKRRRWPQEVSEIAQGSVLRASLTEKILDDTPHLFIHYTTAQFAHWEQKPTLYADNKKPHPDQTSTVPVFYIGPGEPYAGLGPVRVKGIKESAQKVSDSIINTLRERYNGKVIVRTIQEAIMSYNMDENIASWKHEAYHSFMKWVTHKVNVHVIEIHGFAHVVKVSGRPQIDQLGVEGNLDASVAGILAGALTAADLSQGAVQWLDQRPKVSLVGGVYVKAFLVDERGQPIRMYYTGTDKPLSLEELGSHIGMRLGQQLDEIKIRKPIPVKRD